MRKELRIFLYGSEIGADRSTEPERSLGGFNVMKMIQEARPWLANVHAATALDSSPVFRVFLLGSFLVVSASWDLGFTPWVFSNDFCVL